MPYNENAALFQERFPRYFFALREWAPKCGEKRAAEPEPFPLEQAKTLYLYGLDSKTALGLIPWLLSDPKRKLIFLESDTGEIASFLEEKGAKEILLQKQIEIYHLPKGRKKRALLAELSIHAPFEGVFISYCRGDKKAFARLKLALLKTTSITNAFLNEAIGSASLLTHLKKNCRAVPSSFYVESLKDAFASVPAIICGAGPSLERSADTLRTLQKKALLFAGGSAITALAHLGIEPHFAVAIDPNDEEFDRLKNNTASRTPLLYTLRLNSACLPLFKGPLGYVRSGFAGGLPYWLEKAAGLGEPPIGKGFPPDCFSVTLVSAAIAHYLGCNPIFFEGVDLAYTDNRRYCSGVEGEKTTKILRPFDRLLSKESKKGKKVGSAVRWVMEADTLSKLAGSLKDRRWIQCTADGLAVKRMETMPLKEAAKLLPEERDLRSLVQKAISSAPVPEGLGARFLEKLKELEESLDRLLEHLEPVLQETPGLSVLAEIEMQEEEAYRLLLPKLSSIPGLKEKNEFWPTFKKLALEWKSVLAAL